MDGNELADLIDQRWSNLHALLEISHRQMSAIQAGRITELMRLLSDKQAPLQRLAEVAARIGSVAEVNPATRRWASEQARARCRRQQEECEQMHLDLLAMEAECEAALQESRHHLAQNLERVDAGRRAASSYAQCGSESTAGGKLDLISD
jgi:flagellar biosynthesis/type III secretory pathway chaperone